VLANAQWIHFVNNWRKSKETLLKRSKRAPGSGRKRRQRGEGSEHLRFWERALWRGFQRRVLGTLRRHLLRPLWTSPSLSRRVASSLCPLPSPSFSALSDFHPKNQINGIIFVSWSQTWLQSKWKRVQNVTSNF